MTETREHLQLGALAAAGTAHHFGWPVRELPLAERRRQWAGARLVIRALYESDPAGCCLHVVLDDGNTGDDSIAVCSGEAIRRKHNTCRLLVAFLSRLTRAQRRAFLRVRR